MRLLGKCEVFFVFLFFFSLTFGVEKSSIQYIQDSREKIWVQLAELVQAEDCADEEKSAELVSYTGRKIAISQSFARKVLSLDSFGHVQRTDGDIRGHHPVMRLKDLFFKSDVCLPPLDPMMETAVFFFHGLLFQEGVVPGDFAFVKDVKVCRFPLGTWEIKKVQQVLIGGEEKFVKENPHAQEKLSYELQNHLIQISQAVEGERSNTFIALVDEGKRCLDEIEKIDFQKHIITGLLLNPGDHKAENFIITDHSPQRHMINVDNDGVFYHTKVTRTTGGGFSEIQPFGGCKNMLFLLKPLMDMPIDPLLMREIVELDVDDFLRCWISLLDEVNQQIIEMFRDQPSFSKRYQSNFLPLKFPEKAVARIRSDMKAMQDFFKRHQNCTSTELFHFLRPDVADYYSWMLYQHKTYAKSLAKLYGNERPLAEGRVAATRIGGTPLKGRWIFQAIQRYKKSRNIELLASLKELDLSLQDFSSVDVPILGASDLREILLKNSDDSLWREWISEDFLQALCTNRLPEGMKTLYPYDFLQKQILSLVTIDSIMAREIVFTKLKEFGVSQKVFEDFVFFLFEEKCEENALPEGIKKCMASLEQATCK